MRKDSNGMKKNPPINLQLKPSARFARLGAALCAAYQIHVLPPAFLRGGAKKLLGKGWLSAKGRKKFLLKVLVFHGFLGGYGFFILANIKNPPKNPRDLGW